MTAVEKVHFDLVQDGIYTPRKAYTFHSASVSQKCFHVGLWNSCCVGLIDNHGSVWRPEGGPPAAACYLFIYLLCLQLLSQVDFSQGKSGCFSRGKPAATESRCPTYGACWAFSSPNLSLNSESRSGTTDDSTTSFLHFSLFSTALWDLTSSRPVYSVILFSHLFLFASSSFPFYHTLQDSFGQTW